MSFLLKTLERLVDRFIRDDTLIKYLLNENQHAYMAGKSTDTALHVLVGKIEKALYNKEWGYKMYCQGIVLLGKLSCNVIILPS